MADAMPTIAKKITAIVNVSIYSSSFSGVIIRAAMSIRARPPRTINALPKDMRLSGNSVFMPKAIPPYSTILNSISDVLLRLFKCFMLSHYNSLLYWSQLQWIILKTV